MENKLTLKELIWIGTGHVVGAGVVSIVGSALAVTGYSAWLAFALACFLSFLRIVPTIFFTSAVVVPGGKYGLITRCAGESYGGLITVACLLNWAARGTAVLALSRYIMDFSPSLNPVAATLCIWGLFCLANLFGLDVMSKIQSLATPLLLLALLGFSFVCILNIQGGYLDFSSPLMFAGGTGGFFTAVVLLSYSCDGIASLSNYSTRSLNPKSTIPLSMIAVSLITTVLYIIVGFACGAVLPLEYTAGGTMTLTAKYLLPTPLYYAFIFFGPIFALITTMNAGIMDSALPVMAGVKEGWLPEFLAKQNRHGAYYVAIILIFIVGSLPLCLGFSVAQIASLTMVLSFVSAVLQLISAVKFPFVFSEEWQKSKLHIPLPAYFLLVVVFGIIELFVVIKALRNLNLATIIINLAITVFAVFYGINRMKTHKIKQTDYV